MSRDIKYIGMDVHKEAVVIAVLNSSGKLAWLYDLLQPQFARIDFCWGF